MPNQKGDDSPAPKIPLDSAEALNLRINDLELDPPSITDEGVRAILERCRLSVMAEDEDT